MRSLSILAFTIFLALATSCASMCDCDSSASAQVVVESVAKENPDCTRLTLHCLPAGAAAPTCCASTAAERVGKPSDPEDAQAMQSGEVVVLEEPGAIDVTVPIACKAAGAKATCGVTLKAEGLTREKAVARAKAIASRVEAGLGDCCGGK